MFDAGNPDAMRQKGIDNVAKIYGKASGIALTPHGQFGWMHNSADFAFASSEMPEDHDSDRVILKQVAELINDGHLTLATIASHEPAGYLKKYRGSFGDLGMPEVTEFYIQDRREAMQEEKARALEGVQAIFFQAAASYPSPAGSVVPPSMRKCTISIVRGACLPEHRQGRR